MLDESSRGYVSYAEHERIDGMAWRFSLTADVCNRNDDLPPSSLTNVPRVNRAGFHQIFGSADDGSSVLEDRQFMI